MRVVLWLIGLFALAVGLSLFAQVSNGYASQYFDNQAGPTQRWQAALKDVAGATVALGADDPLLFLSRLTDQYRLAREELGFTDAGLSWVQSAYTLAFGGFLLLGARAGDILGRRRMFLIGLMIFTVASVVIAVAPSAAVMLAARAAQGFGSAVLAPSTLALIQTNFEEGTERTRAVALYGAIAGIASSVALWKQPSLRFSSMVK